LNRAYPPGASETPLGDVCAEAHSTANPQVVSTTAISPRRVNTANHGAYADVIMSPGVKFYGVKITYSSG
jgi:hypothetical protein